MSRAPMVQSYDRARHDISVNVLSDRPGVAFYEGLRSRMPCIQSSVAIRVGITWFGAEHRKEFRIAPIQNVSVIMTLRRTCEP